MGVVRKGQDSQQTDRQTALDLAKWFTLYFQICSSSKLLPLKIITPSEQINLNMSFGGGLMQSLGAPRETRAKLSGGTKLNFIFSALGGCVRFMNV